MADKTKAELKEDAERLNVPIESGATKAEIEEALEAVDDPTQPDVYVRRFDPAERKEESKLARTTEGPGMESDAKGPSVQGPDPSAGVGSSNLNTGTAGTVASTTGTTTPR